ncbi:unnamed protein product [Rhizophagus irregularis]|nr:unnamed protein product [Rhizophagus irregularis]CAB5379039.1 unnamed protein product [Rhizophagus irregularis]
MLSQNFHTLFILGLVNHKIIRVKSTHFVLLSFKGIFQIDSYQNSNLAKVNVLFMMLHGTSPLHYFKKDSKSQSIMPVKELLFFLKSYIIFIISFTEKFLNPV